MHGLEREVEDAVALADDVPLELRESFVEGLHGSASIPLARMLTALSDTSAMPELCVNIDHVATVRQARRTYEPDPVLAATEAEAGGADGITVHLREDRRHIQDSDLPRLKEVVRTKLNLEMAATDEMVAIAIALKPGLSMFVPERRAEVIGMVWKALLAGFLATCMTASVVGALPRELFGIAG